MAFINFTSAVAWTTTLNLYTVPANKVFILSQATRWWTGSNALYYWYDNTITFNAWYSWETSWIAWEQLKWSIWTSWQSVWVRNAGITARSVSVSWELLDV